MRGRPRGLSAGLRLACAAALAVGGSAHAQRAAELPARQQRLERLAEVVQARLGITDGQAQRLRGVSGRYARERQGVTVAEREARQALRRELPRGAGADQARVRDALDALVGAQQRRAALVASEQRDLAAFLTPVQRARYLGLQEQARRAAQRVRVARGGDPTLDSVGPAPFPRVPRRRY